MQDNVDEVHNRVNKIIAYIEENFPNPDEAVNRHFIYIKSLLKQSFSGDSSNEINIAKLYEAIHYIETIKIRTQSSFFSRSSTTVMSMADKMVEKGECILPIHERAQKAIIGTPSPGPVPAKAEKYFGAVHHALVDLLSARYQFLKNEEKQEKIKKAPLKWNYNYPLDDELGEVMNQSIGEWQAHHSLMKSDPTKAYTDFKRDIYIRGITAKTDQEVDDLLEYLVKSSSYSLEDQKVIKQWLQSNGGQEMNRFLDLLLVSGEFTPYPAALVNTASLEQGWSIENGNVVFSYEAVIYSINMEGDIRVNNGKGQLVIEDNPENIKGKSGNYSVPPLMKIKSKIELNINEGVVTPSITALNVESYNSVLLNPEAKILNDKEVSMYNK
ncbi:hypothetical protein [Legionella rowbothamii]|uniref:hypothetical protein n=1 Tax=Legionella rowbothamii TaxID=96229 RepID=UPI001056C9D5|nr:hypothetical protein [Legionella rowbothamii]